MGGAHAEGQGTPAGQTGKRRGQAEPDPGGARAVACDGAQGAVGGVDPRQLVAGGAHDHELGRALDEVDHTGVELAAYGRLPGLGSTGQASRQPWHHRGGDGQGEQEDEPGLRQEPPEGGHCDRADQRGRHEGLDHPEHDVLQGVDVIDDAGHEVAAAEAGQAGWREGLEAVVDAHTQVGQGAQGGVVTDEPFSVAEESARQTEELDPDDGQRQRRLRRVLGGT